jgi:hypothetical protein
MAAGTCIDAAMDLIDIIFETIGVITVVSAVISALLWKTGILKADVSVTKV